MSALKRQYKSPPIVEAVFEIRHSPIKGWNAVIDGAWIAKSIPSPFDAPPSIVVVPSIVAASSTQVRSAGEDLGSEVGETRLESRVAFQSSDASRLLVVSSGQLSLHWKPPYRHRGELLDTMGEILQGLFSESEPDLLTRVAVRYINDISVDVGETALIEFFPFGLAFSDPIPNALLSQSLRSVHQYDQSTQLNLHFEMAAPKPGVLRVRIDLDLYWMGEEAFSREAAIERLAALKERETLAFESMITDRVREVFDHDTPE